MTERYKYYTDSEIWRTGRKVVRTLRVVGACGTLYGVGYSAGIANALEDPESATRSLLMQVLTEQCGGAAVLDQSDRRSQLVIRIGGELLAAAHEHLEQAAHEARDAAEREGHVAKLRALQRHHWRFVVIDNDTVNAFVCDLLPGFVFVHRGLLELFESSEDQTAFIIGHELGHYLANHGGETRTLTGISSALQIVVLAAVDPTGIASALLELPIAKWGFQLAFELPASRAHERQADAIGLDLCARACREPARAIRAHKTLAAFEASRGGNPERGSIGATHPATLTRLAELEEQLPEATRLYEASGCASKRRALMRSLRAAVPTRLRGE